MPKMRLPNPYSFMGAWPTEISEVGMRLKVLALIGMMGMVGCKGAPKVEQPGSLVEVSCPANNRVCAGTPADGVIITQSAAGSDNSNYVVTQLGPDGEESCGHTSGLWDKSSQTCITRLPSATPVKCVKMSKNSYWCRWKPASFTRLHDFKERQSK